VKVFEAADGKCFLCNLRIDEGRHWEAHHRRPLALGGEDVLENLVPVHARCHRLHTAGEDIPRIAKAKEQYATHIGARRPKKPMGHPTLRRKVSGEVVEKER
jgi:5-methylcytosine-specific restriction endonuclease McrA